jgi:murein L,D-transpeptidase YafK
MAIGIAVFSLGCPAPLPIPPPPPPRVEPAPPPPELPPCDRIVRVEVRKAARLLTAHCEGGRVVHMIAALGREKTGHKVGVGDERTPEGGYRVVGPREPSKYHGFVPIDYPSQADADAALADGRITPADHARISRAHAEGRMPPNDTPLGGDIGIHGEGRRWAGDSRHLDWTFGCVAVTDMDLDFLASRLEIGVPVEIFP